MSPSPLSLASALFLICIVFRVPLERQMAAHVLLLLPALFAVGWFAGRAAASRWPSLLSCGWNEAGATGLLAALFAGAFWMLPRSLDWSLTEPLGEIAKFVSLPLLVGIPLALSWDRAPLLLRAFLKANAISMALTLAWLYSNAPVRLCTNYLAGQQEQLGKAFLWVAVGLAIVWVAPALGVRLPARWERLPPRLASESARARIGVRE
jgi:hypothetical protein